MPSQWFLTTGDLLRPKVWFLREDKVSLEPPRSCGLAKTDRMGRAAQGESSLNMGVCLLLDRKSVV